jgi:hypothetical protein
MIGGTGVALYLIDNMRAWRGLTVMMIVVMSQEGKLVLRSGSTPRSVCELLVVCGFPKYHGLR